MPARHWLAAARLRTLPLAAASVWCGGLLAKTAGHFNSTVLVLSTATAAALQIFSNFANDYGDARHGADSPLRQGPERMVAAGRISLRTMRYALAASALLCCLLGITLLAVALPAIQAARPQAWLLWLLLGAAAVIAAFTYTAGRKPYGYSGGGDASVLLFFGWLGVLGSEYLHTGRLNLGSLLPATALGLWCAMVLNLNNMRDIRSDTAAGKYTIAARLGLPRAKYYHAALLAAASLMWWLWLPQTATAAPIRAGLQVFLLLLALSHLFLLNKAQSWQALDQLLPQWSLSILGWVCVLWMAV
ncbi:1,4-dihydroxy-2-naphthoate octaprenyltransferase [Uruburuella testudinis]|uniref:1,4-dihydroxy-2-naphthoate octaprenyltransferase n=1 Tax=Uruburuella testudinis TaxID=1282863 RepID=A0ABY4DTG1_9NEIS|nr:1,4-dihydroxy-2-naphthoate octaprenyltransferase [Uruburuella testudinis]UOO82336.1 1,4-dihydroxy-2-naphthoate octaprenyltransferase [Uruburuella testudinis]